MSPPDEGESEQRGKPVAEGQLVDTSLGVEPSAYTCPECHGNLWEIGNGTVSRYRCRAGHSFTEDSLIIQKGETLEAALWTALDALEEQAALVRQMAQRAREREDMRRKATLDDRVADLEDCARLVREVMLNGLPKALPLETGPGGDAAAVTVRREAEEQSPAES